MIYGQGYILPSRLLAWEATDGRYGSARWLLPNTTSTVALSLRQMLLGFGSTVLPQAVLRSIAQRSTLP